MKEMKVVLITFALVVFCFGENIQKQDIDEFGAQIFELIKADKFDKILELTPNSDDFTSIINNSTFPDAQKKQIISQAENQAKSHSESLKKSYELFNTNTQSAGIDWSNFSIDYIDFGHKRKDKIEDVDIDLYVKSNGVIHNIGLHDCLKSEGTWLMGNEIYWKTP